MLASADAGAYRGNGTSEDMMQRTLDYTAVWNDAVALLRAHKEAVIAIAGLLIFLPSWINSYLVGEPDIDGLTSAPAIIKAFEAHFVANWMVILPATLVTMFGAFALYILLVRTDLPRVGDALTSAISLFALYFLISILAGICTFLGFMAFILPGLYISARLVTLPSVVASGSFPGIAAPIKRAWEMTQGVGWATFFLTLIVVGVGSITVLVAGLVFGLLFKLLGNSEVTKLLETGFDALLSAGLSALMIALAVAIYRHLKAQDI